MAEIDTGIIGSGLGTLGTLTDPDTGIPYKTDYYSTPFDDKSGGGYFYGTGYNPSQRFIYQRLRRDSGGDPIKMFEQWETFSDEDKAWIAEADQRRDELTPEEISTIDILKQVGGEAIKPFLQEASKAALYSSGNTLGSLGLDVMGMDARLSDAVKADMGTDSVGMYSVKKATPFFKTQGEQIQALANKAPIGYEYSPSLNTPEVKSKLDLSNNSDLFMDSSGTVYNKRGTAGAPTTYNTITTQGTRLKPAYGGMNTVRTGAGSMGMAPSYASSATQSAVSAGAPSTGSFGYSQTMAGPKVSTGNIVSDGIAAEPGFWSKDAFGARADSAFAPTAMASNFAVSFGVNLITGSGKPKERIEQAADTAIGSTIGTAIGTAIGGPIGGFIGSTIGSIVGGGGRVICNELMRQKLLSREDVILDYRFTKDYLTPTHVRGYHVWAISTVKQMRKGRYVKFWRHIAKHRANEIAYIYGKRDKPDYLGKVYRKIGEPTCWVIGLFCEKSDWSILYKEKKIGN